MVPNWCCKEIFICSKSLCFVVLTLNLIYRISLRYRYLAIIFSIIGGHHFQILRTGRPLARSPCANVTAYINLLTVSERDAFQFWFPLLFCASICVQSIMMSTIVWLMKKKKALAGELLIIDFLANNVGPYRSYIMLCFPKHPALLFIEANIQFIEAKHSLIWASVSDSRDMFHLRSDMEVW